MLQKPILSNEALIQIANHLKRIKVGWTTGIVKLNDFIFLQKYIYSAPAQGNQSIKYGTRRTCEYVTHPKPSKLAIYPQEVT